mgnify:CR=1 FL=1
MSFIIFTNDLALEVSNSQFEKYADDTTHNVACTAVTEVNSVLSRESKPVTQWFQINWVLLSTEKTVSMLFCSRPKMKQLKASTENGYRVILSDQQLDEVETHKLLGLHVDPLLTWEIHVNYICKRLNTRLFLFNKVKHLSPFYGKLQFYNGLVQPIID